MQSNRLLVFIVNIELIPSCSGSTSLNTFSFVASNYSSSESVRRHILISQLESEPSMVIEVAISIKSCVIISRSSMCTAGR